MGSRLNTLGKRREFGAEPRKIEESCQQYRDVDICLPDNTRDKRFQGRGFVIQMLTRGDDFWNSIQWPNRILIVVISFNNVGYFLS